MLDSKVSPRDVSAEIDPLLGRVITFTDPEDVLHARDMHVDEKRAILAGWASDAHAVPNLPAMRQLESGAIVPIDSVLAALKKLDGPVSGRPPARRGGGLWSRAGFPLAPRWRKHGRRHDADGDDDPPPCPTSALPPGLELALMHRREKALRFAA